MLRSVRIIIHDEISDEKSQRSKILKACLFHVRVQYSRGPKYMFNPNPHCFIAITKATACGWKEPLLPHPLHSSVGGRGEEVASFAALKICLIKTLFALKLSSKAHWNLRFYVKPLKQKSLLRYLASHFWFFKNNLLTTSSTYYRSNKKGSLNSIAVRIRVKLSSFFNGHSKAQLCVKFKCKIKSVFFPQAGNGYVIGP
jgi:hypothetical protein